MTELALPHVAASPFIPNRAKPMNDVSLPRVAPTGRTIEAAAPAKLAARGLDFHYDRFHALKGIDLDIPEKQVTALIGPSGCGKSTLLRVFNRLYALYPKQVASGQVVLDGEDILDPRYPMNRLRRKVGMVFQKQVPFPMTIFENRSEEHTSELQSIMRHSYAVYCLK